MQGASDLEQTGQRERAERAYLTASGHWYREPLPLFALANARYTEGDREGAEKALRQSITRKPDYALGWFNLSELLAERGCPGQAEQARACARQLAPTMRAWPRRWMPEPRPAAAVKPCRHAGQ